jgi:hypothetical protein
MDRRKRGKMNMANAMKAVKSEKQIEGVRSTEIGTQE